MKIALVLHIYQPSTQFPEMVKTITDQSYRPLLKLVDELPRAKLTLNIAASLTDWLVKLKLDEVINLIQKLVEEKKIELVGSAKYHPLLPKLPLEEEIRQVKLNNQTNKEVFGEIYHPQGFWPPELAYSETLGKVLEMEGFKWLIVDESAHPRVIEETVLRRSEVDIHRERGIHDQIYQIGETSLLAFFRDREASARIAFSEVTTLAELISNYELSSMQYQILAMDGETFGFHRPLQMEFLRQLWRDDLVEGVTVSELLNQDFPRVPIELLISTWGTTIDDFEHDRIFPRWNNPDNPIHKIQWKLFNLALRAGKKSKGAVSSPWRQYLDEGLQSDQFWWAGHNPCWHPGMIEKGADLLRRSMLLNPKATQEDKNEAQNLYQAIIATGKDLFGEEIVAC